MQELKKYQDVKKCFTHYHGCHGNIFFPPNFCDKRKFFKSNPFKKKKKFKARIKKKYQENCSKTTACVLKSLCIATYPEKWFLHQ